MQDEPRKAPINAIKACTNDMLIFTIINTSEVSIVLYMSVSQNFAAQGIPFPLEGGTPAAKITVDGPLGPFGPAYINAFTIPVQAGPGKYVMVGALYLTHTVPQGQWIGAVVFDGVIISTKTTVISDGGGQAVINIIAPYSWTGLLPGVQVQLGCQSGQVIFAKFVSLNIKTI